MVPLGRKHDFVGHHNFARVDIVPVNPRRGSSLVLIKGNLPDDIADIDTVAALEVNVEDEEVSRLQDHAKFTVKGVRGREDIVFVKPGGLGRTSTTHRGGEGTLAKPHETHDTQTLELGDLLDLLHILPIIAKSGASAVANEAVGIDPILILFDYLRRPRGVTAALGRATVLPYGLGDEGICPVDGARVVQNERIDDNTCVRGGRSCR